MDLPPIKSDEDIEKESSIKLVIVGSVIALLIISSFFLYFLQNKQQDTTKHVIVDYYACQVNNQSDECDVSMQMRAVCDYFKKDCLNEMAFDVINESGDLILVGCAFVNNDTIDPNCELPVLIKQEVNESG